MASVTKGEISVNSGTNNEISSFQGALNRLFASSVASTLAETSTLPTDVIKTRLQVQNLISKSIAIKSQQRIYSGMIDCAICIGRYEGIHGLFKGLQPALIRQISYGGIAFMVFEPIRDATHDLSKYFKFDTNEHPGFVTRIVSGGIAGAFGMSIMNPTDVLKTQMQSNQSWKITYTMSDIIKYVYRNEGIFGFWAGLRPNVSRAFLVCAASIGTYDHAKHLIVYQYNLLNNGSFAHLASSFVASFVSGLVSTPVDVVKTRFMNQAGSNNKQYNKGMFSTLVSIPREEGFFALYKGFYPIICRGIVFSGIFFVTYEKVRAYLQIHA